MSAAKTAISVDRDLLALAEAAARELGTTRSGVISRALTEFLERRRAEQVTAALDALYGSDAADPEAELDAAVLLHKEALKDENPW